MAKLTLQDIASGYQSQTAYNENNAAIEGAIENTLSRDGSTPNQMEADLDMNSNDILNAGITRTSQLYINGTLATTGALTASNKTVHTATATAGQTLFTGLPTYVQGTNTLDVYVNGVHQSPASWTETSTTSITFSEGLEAGDAVVIVLTGFTELNTVSASNVGYTPAGTGAVTTNVQSKLRETVSVIDFGADNTGATSSIDAFNAAIAYANSISGNDTYTSTGVKIHIPAGKYDLKAGGLSDITKNGIHFVGDGPSATTLLLKSGSTVFGFGDGITFIDSCSVQGIGFVCETSDIPDSTLRVADINHGTRLELRNLKILRIPKLITMAASAGKAVTNIFIHDITGQQYDAGKPLIEATINSTGVGAGLYMENIRTNLDGVDAPPESDGSVAHTATVGANAIEITGGTFDTIVGNNCVFNRYYRGIVFNANGVGGITNTYWTNMIFDLGNGAIDLHCNGGPITKFIFEGGWLNATETHTVQLRRTSSLMDLIVFKNTDFLNAGLNNVEIADTCSNVHLEGNRFFGCGRKQITQTAPVKTSIGINVGIQCDGLRIVDNVYRDGFSYYGAGTAYSIVSGDYDPAVAIQLASQAMAFTITGNNMRATTTHYGGVGLTASNLFATTNNKPRVLSNNSCVDASVPEYLGVSSSALTGSGSGFPVKNYSGCEMQVSLTGGTVTNVVVNGLSYATSTPAFFSISPNQEFYVIYSSAPTMRRYLR